MLIVERKGRAAMHDSRLRCVCRTLVREGVDGTLSKVMVLFYGYVVVIASFLTHFFVLGAIYSAGIYVLPIGAALSVGRGAAAWAFSPCYLQSGRRSKVPVCLIH